MPKNENTVQASMTIPAPRYKHGDSVEWFLDFDGRLFVYRGSVLHRMWCEDYGDIPGYWEYCVLSESVAINGESRIYKTNDTVQESELKPWYRSQNRFGNDTRIDTGTEPKRFNNTPMSIAV